MNELQVKQKTLVRRFTQIEKNITDNIISHINLCVNLFYL